MDKLKSDFLKVLPTINEAAPEQLTRYGELFEQLENLVEVVLRKYKSHRHNEELRDVGREKVFNVLRGYKRQPESYGQLVNCLSTSIENAIKDRIDYLKTRHKLSNAESLDGDETIPAPTCDDSPGLYQLLDELGEHFDDTELFVIERLTEQKSKAQIERELVAEGHSKSKAFSIILETRNKLRTHYENQNQ